MLQCRGTSTTVFHSFSVKEIDKEGFWGNSYFHSERLAAKMILQLVGVVLLQVSEHEDYDGLDDVHDAYIKEQKHLQNCFLTVSKNI